MNILLVIPKSHSTGVTNFTMNLAHSMHEKGNHVVILFLEKQGQQQPIEADMYFVPYRYSNIIGNVLYMLKMIAREEIKIVHFHALKSILLFPFLRVLNCISRLNFDAFATAHNKGFPDYSQEYGALKGHILTFIENRIFRMKSIHVIAVSHAVQQSLKNRGIHAKTIYNGVKMPKDNIALDINQFTSKPRYVVLSRLIVRKNVQFLISFFQSHQPDDSLFIVGSGPELVALQEQAKSNPNICFRGEKQDVYDELKKYQVFLSASRDEGLPIAAIEAMAMNMVLILSDIPEHRELKIMSEQPIYFFKNELDLAVCFQKVQASHHSDDNYQVASQFFNIAVTADKYLRFYQQRQA